MDFDSILDHLGHFGKFQFLIIFLACICQIFGGLHMKAGMFLDPMFNKANFHQQRCYIDNCDNENTKYFESFVNFSVPKILDEEGNFCPHPCEQFLAIDSSCNSNSFTNVSVPCHQYIHDYSELDRTVSSEFTVLCKKRNWNGATSQAIFLAGSLFGSAGFGVISDKFGRKTVILTAASILVGSSIGTAFAPNFNIFSILRFITALAVSGLFQAGYIIGVEFVGTSKRLWCANVMFIVFTVGEVVLGIIAYLVKKWRKLELFISIPAAVILLYYWILPESVRWLISKGKHCKAKETVLKAARWNNKTIPEHLLQAPQYVAYSENVPEYETESLQTSSEGPLTLFKAKKLRKWTFNISLNWIVNAMVYYGLSLSASHLSGNIYLNFMVLSALEIPAIFLSTFLLSHYGRRSVLCVFMVFGGIACGSTVFVPQSLSWLIVTLAIVGKSAIGASFAIISVYSTEIFPTAARSTGLGFCSMFSQFGGLIAPVIHQLRKVYTPLPMIIFSLASIVAGLFALVLPETHDRQLPESAEEAERFSIGRMNDILNVPRSRLLSRFGSVSSRHRSFQRMADESRRLLASES